MLHQSDHAAGRKQNINGIQAGIVCSSVFTYDFGTAYTTATDKIELGAIPATAQIIGATVLSSGLTGTLNIGVLAGEPGEEDDTRALTADLFSAQAVNAEAASTMAKCLGVANNRDQDVAIGATVSADVAAGAGSITLRIDYTY